MTYKQAVRPDIKEPNGKVKTMWKEIREGRKEGGKEEGQTIINNFSFLEGRRTKLS